MSAPLTHRAMTARELLQFLQDLPAYMLDRPIYLDVDDDCYDLVVSDACSYVAFEFSDGNPFTLEEDEL